MPLAPQISFHHVDPAPNVGLALLINGWDRSAELHDGTLKLRVGTHGNSLGTLDAELVDPALTPEAGDRAVAFVDSREFFDGTLRDVTISEWRGGHTYAKLGASDSGPDGSLPTAAPWGLSDAPDGVTTRGYRFARRVTRTTEGGAPKSTVQAGASEHGLWANMLVELTSATLGLAAVEYLITDATLTMRRGGVPDYQYELGAPLVSLRQLLAQQLPPPGSITATHISDGAITTPKLAANSVTSGAFATDATVPQLTNATGQVVISPSGVAITGGALTVTNPAGTVIIDGSSDMFRIIATGTLSHTQAAGSGGSTTVTLSALGAQTAPLGFIAYVAQSNTLTGVYWDLGTLVEWSKTYVAGVSGGPPNQEARTANLVAWASAALTSADAFPIVRLSVSNPTTGSRTAYCRWYLLQQVAF